MGVGYRYFTILLHVIGIGWPKTKPVYFHLQTWIPNIIYLALGMFRLVDVIIDIDDEENDDALIIGQHSNASESEESPPLRVTDGLPKEIANVKSVAVMMFFFIGNVIYRVIIFSVLFRRRHTAAAIRTELKEIENRFEKPTEYKRLIPRFGVCYISLISVTYCLLLIIDLFDKVSSESPAWLAVLQVISGLGLNLSEAVCAYSVEGYLIYYSLTLEHYIEEFNDALGLRETAEPSNDKELQCLRPSLDYKEIRLKLSSIYTTFQRCNNFISAMLACSMCDSLVTLCFGIFWISNNLSGVLESQDTLYYVVVKIFVSVIKIIILCVVSDYCNKKVGRTFSYLSGLNPSEPTDSTTNQEVSLLNLSLHSLPFRFTLGGFCELRKPLLPTIAGVVITYTVILCDN